MKTWHIHIEGQVQGVGFRPFVYLLATRQPLTGWVNNTTDGVHIEINAEEQEALKFLKKLVDEAPKLSRITRHHIQPYEPKHFEDFQIIHSDSAQEPNLLLTPDFAMCDDCRAELFAPDNRRKGYPFITCTNCGPRYSIIRELPYDRETTSMHTFRMCPRCKSEYDDPTDRRYYSQTNSCPACPVNLALFSAEKIKISESQDAIIEQVAAGWRNGEIVAIKGIGGYLITCDAANPEVIRKLRNRKNRPSKPFALMFPSLEALRLVAIPDEQEVQLLTAPEAPILLLHLHQEAGLAMGEIAPGLQHAGVMLPYTPLYEILLKTFGKPIIATSGNINNAPIVFQDKKAMNELSQIADYILTNDRDIMAPQDDSVIAFSPYKRQRIIIRRSRGLAPAYIHTGLELPLKSILATGAMLKSTFSFLHRGNIYISQYLGDLEQFDTQESYRHTARHFFDLLKFSPEIILCDKHPEYASTHYAKQVAEVSNIPLESIQHHIAHFGAVLGENNLIHSTEPVLGVIWDGTGLGDDGQIWGGEFFKYEHYNFQRIQYFDYFDFILGDKMPREPRISALSACWGMEETGDILHKKFSPTEWNIYAKLLEKDTPLKTSSVGRIFDAAACLLGLSDRQTYEGEAAMRLEALAYQYFKKNGLNLSESYFTELNPEQPILTKKLMTNLILDLKAGKSGEYIAAKFHFSFTRLVKNIAQHLNVQKIAFSGGTFQNGLLTDLMIHSLSADFELYFHRELSPNDENISFGQLICHIIRQNNEGDK